MVRLVRLLALSWGFSRTEFSVREFFCIDDEIDMDRSRILIIPFIFLIKLCHAARFCIEQAAK